MKAKKIIYPAWTLVSLLAVVLLANYWISRQVQEIQQENQVSSGRKIFKEKKVSYKPELVKIDPENDPLAPMIKEKPFSKAKKMLLPSIGGEVYEVSESTETLVQ